MLPHRFSPPCILARVLLLVLLRRAGPTGAQPVISGAGKVQIAHVEGEIILQGLHFADGFSGDSECPCACLSNCAVIQL